MAMKLRVATWVNHQQFLLHDDAIISLENDRYRDRMKKIFFDRSKELTDEEKAALDIRFCDILKDESMMYNTQIVVKDKWYVRFIAPEEKSVTWWLISWFIVLCIAAGVVYGCWRLWQDPEIRQNIIEALDILKG